MPRLARIGVVPLVIASTLATAAYAKPPRDRLGRPTFGRPQTAELAKARQAKPLGQLLLGWIARPAPLTLAR